MSDNEVAIEQTKYWGLYKTEQICLSFILSCSADIVQFLVGRYQCVCVCVASVPILWIIQLMIEYWTTFKLVSHYLPDDGERTQVNTIIRPTHPSVQ